MKFRRMGTTEITLSEIGFGCGGNAGLMVRGSLSEQTRIVARAIELGINYFDNSPDYGDGTSERNLGRALKTLKARPYLNSKVEVRAENLGDIADHVVRSTEMSLKRLGVDYLDVLQVHNGPVDPAPKMDGLYYEQLWIEHYLESSGVIAGLRRLLDAGKVRHVGFICRGDDGPHVRRLLETGIFSIINAPYSLLNPTAGLKAPFGFNVERSHDEVINVARAHGAGTAIYSPLAGGILTDASVNGVENHPLARKAVVNEIRQRHLSAAKRFRTIAERLTVSLSQLAYQFILAHPGATVALGGFSSIEQLEEIAAVSDIGPISSTTMTEIENIWQNNFTASAERYKLPPIRQ